MKKALIICSILFLCLACKESKTDWKAVYDSLNDDFAEYGRTYSDVTYDKIISKCDLLIESSPEFRNAALMSKSNILAYSNQYDEAVKVAEQIPDTASIVSSFRSKTVYINSLLSAKAENLGDMDSARMYNDKVLSELEGWISVRKDSLYHALMYQPREVPVIRDQHIAAFMFYLMHLSYYDEQKVKVAIENLKKDIPLRNSNTDAYFEYLEASLFPSKDWLAFADEFPKTYDDFMKLYGYDQETGHAAPLYHEAYDHISFLFSDDRILQPEYLTRLLTLTHGFYWEADAPSILRMHIESMLKDYPDLISDFMKDKDDDLVKDFLKCAIATPHPEPENTHYYNEYLKLVELYEDRSVKIVKLFKTAHEELVEEWCE